MLFILIADFNMVPATWAESELDWMTRMSATIVQSSCGGNTCRPVGTATDGRVIDYGIVSTCVAPLLRSFEIDTEVACYPHFGLMLQFDAKPGDFVVREFVKPSNNTFFAKQRIQRGRCWR